MKLLTDCFLEELDEVEDQQKKEMKEFCCFTFNEFYTSHRVWDALVSIICELDCLSSLSRLSFALADGTMCRPELTSAGPDVTPFFDLRSGRHPCLTQLGFNFIPNDIMIGD